MNRRGVWSVWLRLSGGLGDLVQPIGKNAVCLRREPVCEFRRSRSQLRNRNLRGSKLRGMTDIPLLELAWIGFQVKLKRQRVAPIGEGLILIMHVGRQSASSLGQVEAVAVPMHNSRARLGKRVQAR